MFKDKNTILLELKNKFKEYMPNLAFKKNSMENALIQVFAFMYTTLARGFEYSIVNMFPQNAPSDILDLWGEVTVGNRIASAPSTGNVWVTGVEGTEVPTNTELLSDDGLEFVSITSAIIQKTQVSVTAVNVVETARLELTLDGAITFPTLSRITLSNASVPIYNSDFIATVTAVNKITINTGFPVAPAGIPATGFDVIAYGALLPVVSKTNTEEANLSYGNILTLSTNIDGLESDAVVYYEGLTGGKSTESNADRRERILQWLQEPVTQLNAARVDSICREVTGVTRVFTNRATPSAGKCQILSIKDSSLTPFLTQADITYIKDRIFGYLDITRELSDYLVGSPYLQPIDVSISGLSPDTPNMRESIIANLESEINDRDALGGVFDVDLLRRAISLGIDSDTGDLVQNFNIITPSAAILNIGRYDGVYSMSGTEELTITIAGHGIPVGEYVRFDFQTGDAVSGWYLIDAVTTDTITVTHPILTTNGNVILYRNAVPVLGDVSFV